MKELDQEEVVITIIQQGILKYKCRKCHQTFKTQDNAESHFWCLTKEELSQLIKKNGQ